MPAYASRVHHPGRVNANVLPRWAPRRRRSVHRTDQSPTGCRHKVLARKGSSPNRRGAARSVGPPAGTACNWGHSAGCRTRASRVTLVRWPPVGPGETRHGAQRWVARVPAPLRARHSWVRVRSAWRDLAPGVVASSALVGVRRVHGSPVKRTSRKWVERHGDCSRHRSGDDQLGDRRDGGRKAGGDPERGGFAYDALGRGLHRAGRAARGPAGAASGDPEPQGDDLLREAVHRPPVRRGDQRAARGLVRRRGGS